ncbi:MAG: VOC family protein [Nocardioides sp.]
MASPVVHWEIGATDAGKLGTFYQKLFDWQVTPAGPEYFLVAGANGGIGGGILQLSGEVPSYLTFYVQVEELESALRHALELGAADVVPPMTIPGVGRFAMIEDPEGHKVGMLEAAGSTPE